MKTRSNFNNFRLKLLQCPSELESQLIVATTEAECRIPQLTGGKGSSLAVLTGISEHFKSVHMQSADPVAPLERLASIEQDISMFARSIPIFPLTSRPSVLAVHGSTRRRSDRGSL